PTAPLFPYTTLFRSLVRGPARRDGGGTPGGLDLRRPGRPDPARQLPFGLVPEQPARVAGPGRGGAGGRPVLGPARLLGGARHPRSGEHTSELQSLTN